jgi:arylsulfatase A-like enzyme
MTEKAVEFLNATRPDQPFCLIMALKEPHGPLDYFDPEFPDPYVDASIPPPPNLTRQSFEALPEVIRRSLNASQRWLDKPETYQAAMRRIYAYISRADRAVRQIREALVARDFDRNTVVIHLSDNGSMEGAHGLAGKWIMYEESIHVPLIIRDPRLPAATRGRRSQMALNIDVAPTILAMAGVAVPATMQGIDLQRVLRNPRAPGRADWYYEHVYHTRPPRAPIPKVEGVRTERWKYTRYPGTSPVLEQLFDLAADPREETDLARVPAQAPMLTRLRARCDEYRVALK